MSIFFLNLLNNRLLSIMNKIICPECGKSITPNNITKHLNSKSCKNEKLCTILKVDESWKTKNGLYSCPHCNLEYTKHGIASHIWRTHGKGKHFVPSGISKTAWNKGLSKNTDDRVKRNGEAISKTLKLQISNGTYTPKIMGEDARQKLSERQSEHNSGGRTKWFKINDTYVQGSWERDCVLKFNEFGLIWNKVKKEMMIKYQINNKTKTYTPDIILPTLGIILEIKGYWWGNDEEKMRCVLNSNPALGHKIHFIFKDDFKRLTNTTSIDDLLLILKSLKSLNDYFS